MAAVDLPQKATQCDNCHSLLQGPYCHQCGQEKRNILRNIFGLVGEFFGEFSNWDARLWQTLLPLWFKPGRLTQRYVSGHRAPYVPALRLYLFSSIIAFLVFAKLIPTNDIQFNNADGQFGLQYNPAEPVSADVTAALKQLQTIDGELAAVTKPVSGAASAASDVVLSGKVPQPEPVVATAPDKTARQATTPSATPTPVKLLELDGDQDIESLIEQLFDGKLARLKDNPQLAVSKFFSLAPQMMFLLLPLFALLLKLLYIRNNRFYMEHLLLCLHSHSAMLHMFIAFTLLTYMASLTSTIGWLQQSCSNLALAILWYMLVYLLLSQKVFYGQGWRKTLVKFCIFSISYIVLLSFALLVVLLLSLYWA